MTRVNRLWQSLQSVRFPRTRGARRKLRRRIESRRLFLEQLENRELLATVSIEKIWDGTESGTQPARFRLSRDTSMGMSSVMYTISGTATPASQQNADHNRSVSGMLSLNDGQTEMYFDVTPIDDQLVEASETVVVTISAYPTPPGTQIGTNQATALIVDNDAGGGFPTVTVAATDSSAAEQGSDDGVIRITRDAAGAAALVVNYTLSGMAINGTDFLTLSGSATIPAGATFVDVVVDPIDDQVVEMSGESVMLMLSMSSSYTLGSTQTASITIADNDTMPTAMVSIGQTHDAIEGGEGGYFRLTRSGSMYQELTVSFLIDVANSQATSGGDFSYLSGSSSANPTSGTVTFGAGSSSVDISVQALADAANEGTESLRIQLVAASSYSLGTSSAATLWIVDNAAAQAPVVTIGKRVSEVQTIALPEATGGTWTISVGNQTTTPLDYGASSVNLQSALEALANVGLGNVAVGGSGTLADPFQLTFRNALWHTDMPQVVVDLSGLTGVGAPAAVVGTETQGVDGQNQVFEVAIRSLDAMGSLDPMSGSLRFLWGDPGSGEYPASETPRRSPAVVWTASPEQIKTAIEQIPNVVGAGGTVAVSEIESTSQLRRLRIEFTGGLGNRPISSLIAVNDVANDPILDSTGAQGLVETSTIMAGVQGYISEVQVVTLLHVQGGDFALTWSGESTIAIPFNANAAQVEQALKGLVGIGSGDVSVSGQAGGPWTIAFQGDLAGLDVAPLQVETANLWGSQAIIQTISHGGSIEDWGANAVEGGTAGYFRVHRDGPTTDDLVVFYSLPAGSTAQSAVDYEALTGSVTIPAGQALADIFVRTIEDTVVEVGESVRIALADPPSGYSGILYTVGDPSEATVAITDNDVMGPMFSIAISATQAATEGGADGFVRILRTAATPAPVTVNYELGVASTATGSDYTPLSGSVTIPAYADSADIPIHAVNDLDVEGTEQLEITLISVSSIDYTLSAPSSATVSILDNDQASSLPFVKVAGTLSTSEGGTPGRFRLARSGALASPLTVNFTIDTTYSTAENGIDTAWLPGTSGQSPLQGSVTFAAGSAAVDIPIVAIDDSLTEGTESLRISLVVDSPATYALGMVVVGSAQIRDNESASVGPQVSSVGLINDTGASATDRVTSDPRLQGIVAGDFAGGTARVEFDHDGDGQVDGDVVVVTSGAAFSYDPRTSDPSFAGELGVRTVSYRVVHLASGGGVLSIGRWNAFGFELEDFPGAGPVRIHGLKLKRDTGPSATDRITVNPTLVGSVLGDFAGGTVRLEFDHQGNGSINGQLTVTTSGAAFTYDPRQFEPALAEYTGALRLRYRIVQIDPAAVETAGAWSDFDLTLEQAPTSSLVVQGVHLQIDDSEEYGTGQTLVAGEVTGPMTPAGGTGTAPPAGPGGEGDGAGSEAPPPGAFVPVEIDTNGDGIVDDRVFTGEDRAFTYDPTRLGYGQHTIRMRATEWRTDYAMEIKGQWTTFTFTLAPAPGPAIADVSLVNDTGESDTDGITADPTVRGSLASSVSAREHVNIEFEWTGDSTVDGDTWTDEQGDFQFTPHGLTSGSVTLRARGTRWDSVLNEEVAGAWLTFTFTFDGPTTPTVTTLALLNDTGASATDNITHVSTLVGQLAGPEELADIDVQFDHNGDGQVDGTAKSQADGQFVYEPAGLAVGSVTVRARTAFWNENTQAIVQSDWTSLTFTLENPPNLSVSVDDLGLLSDTGASAADLITTNPTLIGQIANDGPVAQLVVEFDHNGDGTVDGTTTTGNLGDFVYLPRGLTVGTWTMRARAIEWDYQDQQNLVGAWTPLTFQLEAAVNVAPVVQSLGLLSDSGTSATDNVTANPTLTGLIADDRSAAGLGVELDFNGDGVVDAQALTDDKGEFRHEPKGLAYGAISVRARAVEWDDQQDTYLRGAWSAPFAFTYESQSNQPARLVELLLDDPLPGSQTTGQSFRGRITNEGALADVAIEFDYNSDGQVDQATQTDLAGKFAHQPTGLSDGPITIQVRTRETDPVSRQILRSAWQSYSFTYESVALAMPQVTALALVNDTGTSNTDKITTDSKLQGTVSSTGASGFVLVQFDHNGDGVIDGDVVAGRDLQFAYEPEGLAAGVHTLRARTKDYDRNSAVVYGAWLEFVFTLEASAASALTVTQLALASDTGNSNTDGSTGDPTLSGQVGGVPGSTQITIQFDHDGDGAADGTTTRYGSGSFSYDPLDLPTGLNTVFARAVPPAGSELSPSDWVSISFVYSTDPDGAEAQALVPLLATLNGGNASAQGNYQGALSSAANNHRGATQAADNQYDNSVQGAVTTRNQSVDNAESSYKSAIQAADAAYLAALDAAAAALQTDLANFGGDSTSFDFQPFAWPESPQRSALELPSDSAQPLSPVAPPTYTGPTFSPSGVQSSGISSADETLRAARQAAKTAYDNAVDAANEQYRQDLKTAEVAYRNALNNAQPPFDLDAEYTAHRDRVQAAYDIYKAAIDASADTHKSAMQQAWAALQQAITSADQAYNSTVQPAYQSYMQTVMDPSATWADKRNAYLNYRQTVFNADKTRDQDVADARRQYDSDASGAGAQKAKSDAAASETYSKSVAASQNILDKKNADYRHWQKTYKINARETFEHAKVEATRTRARSIADAQRTLDEAEANAVRQRDLTVATETVGAWQADVNSRLAATQSWHLVQQTPWSAYQLALVNAEAQYISQRAGAYTTRTTAMADAKRTEALAVADAAKTRGYARAESNAIRDHAWVTAKAKYWRAPADAEKTRAYAVADHRKTRADAYATAAKAKADADATAGDNRNNGASEAYYQYDTDSIGARQFYVSSTSSDPCYWGCEYVDGASLVNFAADRDLALAQTHYDYVIAGFDSSLAYHTAVIDANKQYRDDNRAARTAEEGTLGTALETYHKEVALADKIRAVKIVEDDGVEQNAVASAHVTYVSASALAEKTYALADAQARAGRTNADAAGEQTYRSAEAGQYASILSAWNTFENSRWSQYHVGLGQAESAWAAAVGAAHVAYASAVATADVARATAIANADEVLANAHATSAQTRTGSLVTASNTYATNVAPAKLTWAEELAKYVKEKEADKDTARADYDQSAALFEHDESIQSYADEDSYRRAMAGAMLTYRQGAIDAARQLALSDNSPSAQATYQQALESATDTYNTAARAAWDALRTARAASMVDRQVFYATASETLRLETRDDGLLLVDPSDLATAARALADTILAETNTLATAKANADKAYASALANAELVHANAAIGADAAHQYAVKTAEANERLGRNVADSAKREDVAAARGIYEVALYADHAAALQSAALSEGTPLSALKATAAAADAAWADAVRLARDLYHDALSYAGYNEAFAVGTADLALASAVITAQANQQSAVAAAQAGYSIATANAAADLALANTAAEAGQTRQELEVRIAYDTDYSVALADMAQALANANVAYATDAADAWRNLYLDNTDEWTRITGLPTYGYGSGDTSYYGGGDPFSSWGWGGGGFGWGGLAGGGYVMGPWSDSWFGGYYGWGGFGWGGLYGYGWGFGGFGWGWGYGWGWDWGYGGFGGWGWPWGGWNAQGDQQAWQDYQNAMQQASDDRTALIDAAQLIYVTAIGDAQIDRATSLGDLAITLATARGNAGVAYVTAVNGAEGTLVSAELSAGATLTSARNSAEVAYSTAVASARQTNVAEEQAAEVGLKNLERAAAVTNAQGVATAEADYHITIANQSATALNSWAAVVGTAEANFRALNAEAQADWLVTMKPAYVTHAANLAQADGDRAYHLAVAWELRENQRAAAEATYAIGLAGVGATRIAGETTAHNAFRSTLQAADSARSGAGAASTRTYEILVATEEKEYAIAYATADKEYHRGRVQKQSLTTLEQTRKTARADAVLAKATDVADGKLAYLQGEIAARKTYTVSAAAAQTTLEGSLATLGRTAAIDSANYQAGLDNAFAQAEGTYWYWETVAENIHRAAQAAADGAWWLAQENASIAGVQSLDAAVNLPWTDYLVDRAVARRDWWVSTQDDYLLWVNDRNVAEAAYQASLSIAHINQGAARAAADGARAMALADAEWNRASAAAAARDAYFTALAGSASQTGAAQTLLQGQAQAERTYEVAKAQALRNHQVTPNQSVYDSAVQAAETARKNTLRQLRNTYGQAESSAVGTRHVALAQAERNFTATRAGADQTQKTAYAAAERDAQMADATAYVTLTTAQAGLDKAYWLFEADALATAAANLAAASGTPWAAYQAAEMAEYETWVVASAPAQEQERIGSATAQATAEIAWADAQKFMAIALAGAEQVWTTALADAQLLLAQAQGAIIAALGSSFGYNPSMPTLGTVPGIDSYAVTAAGEARYYVDVTFASNPYGGGWGYGWGWGLGGWWGGFYGWGGYFGGWGFSPFGSIYGYGYGLGDWDPLTGYLGGGSSSSLLGGAGLGDYNFGFGGGFGDPSLPEPQPPLPLEAGFWDLAGAIGKLLNSVDYTGIRYAWSSTPWELVGEQGFAAAIENGALQGGSVQFTASSKVLDRQEVAKVLSKSAPEVGAYFSSRGQLSSMTFPGRPSAADPPPTAVPAPEEQHAEEPPEGSLAAEETWFVLPPGMTAMEAAEEVKQQVQPAVPAQQQPAQQPAAPQTKPQADFHRFQGARRAALVENEVPRAKKLQAYLEGILTQDNTKFGDQALEIIRNLHRAGNLRLDEMPAFGKGFVIGFFKDGLWGNVEGIGALFSFAWKAGWFVCYYDQLCNSTMTFFGYDFAAEKAIEKQIIDVATIAFQITQAIGAEIGEQAYEHYRVLKEGTPDELRALGTKHQQVAAALMALAVGVSEQVGNVSAETKGRIYGAVVWEVVQTIAEILLTAGISKIATGGAKFAHIADKLADFAKYSDKFGDAAKAIAKLAGEGSELRKILNKLDDVTDKGRDLARRGEQVIDKVVEAFCFTPDTLVSTIGGQKRLGDIEPGEYVHAFDHASGRWVAAEVQARHDNVYSGLMTAVTVDGQRIEATGNHPFWVQAGQRLSARPWPEHLVRGADGGQSLEGRWVNSQDLLPGDQVVCRDGQSRRIERIELWNAESIAVCNLTIRDQHTFAVGTAAVLVHNSAWCDILIKHDPNLKNVRTNLAKKFNVPESRIHGHHVVQKTIPQAGFDIDPKTGKQIIDHLQIDPSWTSKQREAWYISESQKMLDEVGIPMYRPSDFGGSEAAAVKALDTDLANGKKAHNLTLAFNDKELVHNEATLEAVYKRLSQWKGQKAKLERELTNIGDIFQRGNVPTPTGEKVIPPR